MGPKCKYINGTTLSKTNKSKLMKHSHHHTLKHIKSMVKDMKKGASFNKSHKDAIKKVGK
tara:strand:- start:2840 stop:3019 length:180 start_codon:yes stop_codon:yes gene_type:complete